MRREDIPRVVAIHLAAFPGFFLSSLGSPFLNLYYAYVWEDKTSIALVAGQARQIIGFVVRMAEPGGFYRRAFLKHAWPFALALIAPSIHHPPSIMGVIRRLRMAGGATYEAGEALLASIAVDPALQSNGTGGKLIEQFLVEAKVKGARTVSLTTQTLNNDSAHKCYRRNGFISRRALLMPEGRRMNEYWRPL